MELAEGISIYIFGFAAGGFIGLILGMWVATI
jgi:hypothetical protein